MISDLRRGELQILLERHAARRAMLNVAELELQGLIDVALREGATPAELGEAGAGGIAGVSPFGSVP